LSARMGSPNSALTIRKTWRTKNFKISWNDDWLKWWL
jgi:hypothetical protein